MSFETFICCSEGLTRMKPNISGITSLVLVLVAFSSLVSMIALTRIDNIVHRDLYNYGLTFSYTWAMPYWTMTTLVFAMGWFNIIITIAFQFYVLLYGRREAGTIAGKEISQPKGTYQPPVKEKPIEAQREETIAPPIEAEPEEPVVSSTEETAPYEYTEAQQPQEVEQYRERTIEEEREEPAAPTETEAKEERFETAEETPTEEYPETKPPEEAQEVEEPHESTDAGIQEETSYVEVDEGEYEDKPSETVEIEEQETASSATEGEETREQEAELTEP